MRLLIILLIFLTQTLSASETKTHQNETKMDLQEYRNQYKDEQTSPGWDAIDAALLELYPKQEPKHYAPDLHFAAGGEDPLDGVSVYDAGSHLHIVTYGFSSLYYDEESLNSEFSKFGFELTMRLKKTGENPYWAINMLQNIARYVFKSGNWFEAGHFLPTNSPIKLGSDTKLVGLAFDVDSELGSIDTVHGNVQFLQVFGITQKEFDQMKDIDKNALDVLSQHKKTNPLLITDLSRGEILP